MYPDAFSIIRVEKNLTRLCQVLDGFFFVKTVCVLSKIILLSEEFAVKLSNQFVGDIQNWLFSDKLLLHVNN